MLEGIHLKNIFTLEDRENLWELMEKEKGIKEIFHDKQDRVNSSVVSCLIKKEEEIVPTTPVPTPVETPKVEIPKVENIVETKANTLTEEKISTPE